MELGEHICIPAGTPKCHICPWQSLCEANRLGKQTELPKKSPKKEKRTEDLTVLLLICGDRIALQKRPDSGLLAGLWEFPNLAKKQTPKQIESFLREQGLSPLSVTHTADATHIFTHVVWNMTGISATFNAPFGDFRWVTRDELKNEAAIPTAFRAYVKYFLKR